MRQMPRGSEEVQRLFSQSIPEELWHYTKIAGFKGVCESNRVWATDVYFTNDEKDFVHSKKVAEDFLESYSPSSDLEAEAIERTKKIVAEVFHTGSLSPERLRFS